MKKLEDQTILQLEDLNAYCCFICNTAITWIKDENGFPSNCDRRFVITSKTCLASVTKNPNIILPKPDNSLQNHKIEHPEKVIKWHRYV